MRRLPVHPMGILPTSAKLEFPTLISVQAGECVFQFGSSLLSVGGRDAEFSCGEIEHGDEVVG